MDRDLGRVKIVSWRIGGVFKSRFREGEGHVGGVGKCSGKSMMGWMILIGGVVGSGWEASGEGEKNP
jgi:hypothetical protein